MPLKIVRHDRLPTVGRAPQGFPHRTHGAGSIGMAVDHPTATNPESEQL
jgi:hypothetical protein